MEYIVLHALFTPLAKKFAAKHTPTQSSSEVSLLEIKARAAAWELPTSNGESTIRETACLQAWIQHSFRFLTGYCLSATNLPKQKSTHKNVFPSSTIEILSRFAWKCPSRVLKLFVGGQFRWLIPQVWAHMQCQKWHSCIHLVF